MKGSYFAVVVLNLAAFAVRTSYELSKRAGRLDPKNRALFLVILLDMILLWASWFTLCPMDPLRVVLPPVVRWASLAVGLAGIGNILFWRHVEEQHLETCYGEAYRAYRANTWFWTAVRV